MKELTWKTVRHRIGPPVDVLYVGRVRVGSATQALTARGETSQYEWHCLLPGLAGISATGKCDTIEQAKDRCERATKFWFDLAT